MQCVGGGHRGFDAEFAGVGPRLGGDERLDVTCLGRRHRELLGLGTQGIEVAARGDKRHVKRLPRRQRFGRPRVVGIGKQLQGWRLIGHHHAHRVRVDTNRLRLQPVHEQQAPDVVDRASRVRVDLHFEAACERLAGRDVGRKTERHRIDLAQVGRRRAGVVVLGLALQVVERQRAVGRTERGQRGVGRDHVAQQHQGQRRTVHRHWQAAGGAVAGVAGGQRQQHAITGLWRRFVSACGQLHQCAIGHRDAVDVGRRDALGDAAGAQVEPRHAAYAHPIGNAAEQHQISEFARGQRAELIAVAQHRLVGVGNAVAVAIPHQTQVGQVVVVVAAIGKAQRVAAARVAGVGQAVRQAGIATGRALQHVVAGQGECFERLYRDRHGVRLNGRIEAAVGVEVGRVSGVVESAAGQGRRFSAAAERGPGRQQAPTEVGGVPHPAGEKPGDAAAQQRRCVHGLRRPAGW